MLRKWEKAARETSYICNQAAGFNCCVTKLQNEIQVNFRILQKELAKGKGSQEAKKAVDDPKDLCAFNRNISVCLAKSMQHMTDSLFITISNFTLMRRDAYLDHLKPGVKQDNWCTLRNAPLHSYGLFPDDALHKAEENITKFKSSRRTSQPGSGGLLPKKANCFYPYPSVASGAWKQEGTKSRAPSGDQPAWRSFGRSVESD